MKTFLLKVEEDLWRQFKSLAALRGYRIMEVLVMLIRYYVQTGRPK